MSKMQKPVQFYTLFQKTNFTADSDKLGYFTRRYKTLIDAFGGRFSVKTGEHRRRSKRTPLLDSCLRGSGKT